MRSQNTVPNKKLVVFLLLLLCFVSVFFILIYREQFRKIKIIDVSEYKTADESIVFQIEKTEKTAESFSVEGFATKVKMPSYTYDCSVLLKNLATNQYYKLRTQMLSKPDYTQIVNDGFSHDTSGFFARAITKKLPQGEYEVVILYGNNKAKTLIPTAQNVQIGQAKQ